MAADTPAVILGAGLNGLGVARSLARAGVPAWMLDSDPARVELRTRAARALPIQALSGDALVADLLRLAQTHFAGQRPVLLLTQEETVRTISRHRAELAAGYRFRLPPDATVQALQHKEQFQHLAERHHAPIPALIHVRSETDLAQLERLQFPVAVKPNGRSHAYSQQFKKAYRIETAGAAAELLRRILPVMDDMVVQEWTEGPDSNIYFCLQVVGADGHPRASFSGRKVRSWPPQIGGTASCVPAPEADAELAALTADFFAATGVVGMAGMEYKRDARSGAMRMVEPTIGRTDYQAEIATLNGVNLPHAAWCDALGRPWPGPAATPRALGWRVHDEDVQSAMRQGQSRGAGFETVTAVRDALWRGGDPVPAGVALVRRVRRALGRRLGKPSSSITAPENHP